MATSPNYGWSEPDNTSLVKDGALAMRTLGDAIDTSVWNVGFGQAGKNKIINGAMQIWQRGTSFPNAATIYAADRWQYYSASSTRTVSRVTTSDTTNLPDIQYAARIQRPSGNTATDLIAFGQSLESVNSIPFAGKTVTFSFYARRGANYSAASNVLNVQGLWGTGTDQSVITTGYTGQTSIFTGANASLTTTWQRFSYTGTVGSTATEVGFRFNFTPVGTAGADDYYEVTGVQVEVGSKATPFQTASGGSIQGELAMCQRYYYRAGGTGGGFGYLGTGIATSTTGGEFQTVFPVTMRVTPTLMDFSTIRASDGVTGSGGGTLTINAGGTFPAVGAITLSGVTGLTQYRPYFLQQNSSSTGYVGFSAEL